MNTFLIPVDFFENNKEHVFLLQQGLTTLSYSVDASELAERVIGPTTKTAILSFRQDHGLATSMKVSLDMINLLNKLLEQKYRVCGYITDSKNKPVEGVTVKCELSIYQKDPISLGQGITLKDASYRIYLDQNKLSTLTGTDGLLLHKLCVRIIYYKYESEKIIKENLFIENIETIFNFSSDKLVYTGESIYQSMKTVLNNNSIKEEYLSNVKKPSELLTISSFTGIDKEILIREMFAWEIAASLGLEEEDTQAIFGYLYQNYPPNMPLQLFTDEVKDMDENQWIQYKNNILFQVKTGLQIMPGTLLSEILKIACKEYYIDYHDDKWVSGIVSTIVNTQKDAYYTQQILEGNVTLEAVINCAGVSMTEEAKMGIAALFVAYINDFNRFIEVLNSAEYRQQYGDGNVDKLIETFQISRFVRNYISLLNGVKAKHQANLLKYSYRYLASLEKSEWEILVNDYGCPEGIKPEDYVNLICENIQKTCPDVNTIVQFKKIAGFKHLEEIKTLLLANKTFNLLTGRAEFLTDNEEIKKEVKTVQRIYRITPSPEVAKTMMSNGIKNAGEVYFMGKRQLEERFKEKVDQKDIDAVFDMAAARFSNSLNAFANINNAFNNLTPQTISRYDLQAVIEELKKDFPDIETLFGNTDYCECEHDSSVYSAAAYLGDLLAYMDARSISPTDNTPLKTVFDARRSDISNIYLNKQNTNTVMPYIDLVNEVLEEAVIKTEHDYHREVEDCQSTLSSEELCAAPEHLLIYDTTEESAYDILARQIYPMYAPFNIYQTESRSYLKKLGIIRYELMECLQNKVGESLSPLPNTIAAEYFGLTLPGKNIITADSSINLATRNKAWHNLLSTGVQDIKKMLTLDFMQDSALSLYEVFDILASNWIGVTSQGFTTNCSYKNKEIEGSVEQFDKAHRFIRFYQKSGWKIWELNLLLNSRIVVQSGYSDSLNAKTFYNLMLFKRQQEKLNLSCDALLAFYQEINRKEGYINAQKNQSLYERIFLRTSLSNPVNPDLNAIFKNPDDPKSKFYPKDYSLIAASLSTFKGDIEILIKSYDHLNGFDSSDEDPHDFACLNYLYRHVVLSQKLNISANELLILEGLCGVNRLQYELNDVDLLIKTSAKIKNFDFTVDNYDFLINRTINPADSSLYKDNISKLHDALLTLLDPPTDDQISANFKVDDAYRQEFTDYLSNIDRFQDPDKINALIRIIECTSGKREEDIDKFVADFFPAILGVEMLGNLHYQIITTKKELENRYALVTNYVNDSMHAISIQAIIASICDLPGDILNPFILHDITISGISEETTLLKELCTRNYYFSSPQNLQTVRIALFMLDKFSMTVEKANLSVADFQLLFDLYDSNKLDFDWLSFRYTADSVTNTVFQFLELLQMLALRKSYGDTSDGNNLFSMIKTSDDISSFLAKLCSLTGWICDEVTSIGDYFSYNFADYTKSQTYPVIEQCLAYRETANVPWNTLYGWRLIAEDSDKEVASQIKSAAKSHYDIDTWLKDELPDIQNPLRELKADALASFLIEYDLHRVASLRKGWNDKIDLYNYFFLDTEMTALMKTSRIVQATCSVQLFVQRCILNLETKVVVDEERDGEWKQWEWMKKYRLWEANRKIFLYPENWIEPELRDDKTPYFKELEEEIDQSDVTEEQVETAFENYLHKLQTVSNLTVCGIYREVLDNSGGMSVDGMELKTEKVDTLHVVGKTKSSPVEYYYRSYDALNAKWSYWEKIELDIKGENVIPMVYNRRLYLFWLSTVEKSYNNSSSSSSAEPDKYTEIQLGWSMLQNKKWSGVHYSQKKHLQYRQYPASDYSLFAYYNEKYNEIIFSVYNLFYLNEDNPKEYHSCDNQAGIFYFDGDVYRVLSNINQFGSGDYQGAIGEAKQVAATTLNQPTNGDISLILKEQFITQLSNLNDEHLQLFNKLSNGLGEEVKSEPMIMLNGKSYVYPARSVLRASRLYPMEKDEDNKYKIYLHDNNSTDFYTTRILTTSNQLPNLVQMMHSLPTMWYGLFQSHLLSPMFYQDAKRTFFVKPVNVNLCDWKADYKFYPFYHPYINLFIKELNREGINGLLNREIQIQPQNYHPQNSFNFDTEYEPADNVQLAEEYQTNSTAPHDILDFNPSGAYSAYNRELFFHIPFYIACKLSQNQKYEEAMSWFHYIFNPTDKTSYPSPQKYWIFKPFFTLSTPENRAQQIREILKNIEDHAAEVNAWLNNPYNPHLVARTRPVAYQKAVVMKYIDNLIAWADQLFRQDSMESNNEATLLYILAYEILGKRPVMMPKTHTASSDINYNDIKDSFQYDYLADYDTSFHYAFGANTALSNIARPELSQPAFYQQKTQYVLNNAAAKGTMENLKSSLPTTPVSQATFVEIKAQEQPVRVGYVQKVNHDALPRIDADNFCIPYNENLLSYWTTVEDRLFKLRNCMNIEGVVRELPLFEPPIDPAMLVKAAAAGLSIGDALNEITVPQPYYRFRVMMQKAVEFTNEVKQFGDKLLSALEKKDAETLNLLRSSQEITMQKAIKQIKKLQINEAEQNIESINENIKIAQRKEDYYGSKEFMNSSEQSSYDTSVAATVVDATLGQGRIVAGTMNMIPDFSVGGCGFGGSPVATMVVGGGQKIASAMNATLEGLSMVAQLLDKTSSLLSVKANYQRRKEEWDFQAEMAGKEMEQLNKQLTASEIRLMTAEKELENLELQIEQSQSVKEYYQNKYTNESLYNWMITKVSGLYFQAYKLAYDMAKKAEQCYCYELGIYDTPDFIQFGYWDSLKKGLLAGDQLIQDLHRLDAAYYDRNKRTMELTKHISLAQMDPLALVRLITEGSTTLELPEFIFDMDYPGHYMRRIKSVSVTIPNVAGPYTNVSFMLTLQSAKIRKNATGDNYDESTNFNDSRFVYQTGGRESICTSSAQNDSGMFELNFGGERYLPFENSGVIGKWGMSLPAGCNQFDLSTISDVILHINYTALYDGNLAIKAKEALQGKLPKAGALLFSPKQNFPDAWNQMDPEDKIVNFEIKTENLPFFLRGMTDLKIDSIAVMLSVKKNSGTPAEILSFVMKKGGQDIAIDMELSEESQSNKSNVILYEGITPGFGFSPKGDDWSLQLDANLDISDIEEIEVGFTLTTEAYVPTVVTGTTPENGATVEPDTRILVQFNKNVTAKKLQRISLKDEMDNTIPVRALIDENTLFIIPSSGLQYSRTYTVSIPTGTLNECVQDESFGFTTCPLPLIHHFPLSSNGNLSDSVGAGSIAPQSTYFVWVAAEGKYKATAQKNLTAATISGLTLGMEVGKVPNNVTFALKIKPVSYQYSRIAVLAGIIGLTTYKYEEEGKPVIAEGETAMIAVSFKNGVVKYYKNGELIKSVTTASVIAQSDNTTSLIGKSPNYNGAGGFYIWDIMFFNKVLTDENIRILE